MLLLNIFFAETVTVSFLVSGCPSFLFSLVLLICYNHLFGTFTAAIYQINALVTCYNRQDLHESTDNQLLLNEKGTHNGYCYLSYLFNALCPVTLFAVENIKFKV